MIGLRYQQAFASLSARESDVSAALKAKTNELSMAKEELR